MIFLCLGSREYQFNRLLEKIDKLIEGGKIKDIVFAQIGQSTYIPKNYEYKRFMDVEDFKRYQKNADLIISHGGTGALVGALKMGKQVIAVPRLAKYGEHIDDHQMQVSEVLGREGYLKCVVDINNLEKCIKELKEEPITKYYNKPSMVIGIIEDFLQE